MSNKTKHIDLSENDLFGKDIEETILFLKRMVSTCVPKGQKAWLEKTYVDHDDHRYKIVWIDESTK